MFGEQFTESMAGETECINNLHATYGMAIFSSSRYDERKDRISDIPAPMQRPNEPKKEGRKEGREVTWARNFPGMTLQSIPVTQGQQFEICIEVCV